MAATIGHAHPPLTGSGTGHGHDDAGDHVGPTSHHGHGHGPGHHVHSPDRFGRAFALGIAINAAFIVVEIVAGFAGHSVALMADAGHNVADVLGLLAAWLAHVVSRRPPTARFTYGLGSSSILAALLNGVLLLVAVGGLSLEAVQRLIDPAPVAGGIVMGVAALGVMVNGGTAMLFFAGRHDDLNVKAAYLHMAGDAIVSVGVILAGGLILTTGWLWIDPVASLVVNLVIVAGTWSLLRDGVALSLDAVPADIEAAAVRDYLLTRDGVSALHDFHVWPMSTTQSALTAHLVMPAGHPGDDFLTETATQLRERFRIGHMTLQIETSPDSACPLAHGHAEALA